MKEVKITVLMPAYNAGKYIAEAIESVLDQPIDDFELLIVNDGSTDNTVSVIQSFNDSRIRLLQQPRQGVVSALNEGLAKAKGYYIARFDADDICFSNRLQKQVDFLDQNPGYVLTGCDAEYITEAGEFLFNHQCTAYSHEDIMNQLYIYCPFIHSGVMYRKEEVLKAGGYPAYAHNFEDYLLWIRLAKYGNFCNLPERLIKVRLNPSSATMDEKWRGRRFRKLKKEIIYKGEATKEEGDQLLEIISKQDAVRIKNGAYYALCGKKFLVNNYHPVKARINLGKSIRYFPFRLENYALYLISFFPRSFINWLHLQSPNKL